MAKKIYMGRPSDHIVINKQLPIWDKNKFCTYKKIYLMSKALIFLKSKFDSLISQ